MIEDMLYYKSHDQIYICKSALWLCECNESMNLLFMLYRHSTEGPWALQRRSHCLRHGGGGRKISSMVRELRSQNKNYFN